MKQNVGKTDKTLRIIIAVALFIIGVATEIAFGLKVLVFLFSGVALLTALFGTCPLYTVLGISTEEKEK
jgi:hypothetical protein